MTSSDSNNGWRSIPSEELYLKRRVYSLRHADLMCDLEGSIDQLYSSSSQFPVGLSLLPLSPALQCYYCIASLGISDSRNTSPPPPHLFSLSLRLFGAVLRLLCVLETSYMETGLLSEAGGAPSPYRRSLRHLGDVKLHQLEDNENEGASQEVWPYSK